MKGFDDLQAISADTAALGILAATVTGYPSLEEKASDEVKPKATMTLSKESTNQKHKNKARARRGDGVTSYMKAVSSFSLLNAQREKELAKIIHQGLEDLIRLVEEYADEDPLFHELNKKIQKLIGQQQNFPGVRNKIIKVITRVIYKAARQHPSHQLYGPVSEDIRQIMKRVDDAKQEMVKANLRLVLSIAKRFRGRGLSFEDLVQEGNLGLIKAVVRYDHTKGNRFSTYATWWVRQSIIRGIYDKSRTIRLPVHCIEQRNRCTRVFNELVMDLGRDPTLREIADHANIDIEKLQAVLNHTAQHLSLETPLGDEEQRLGDLLIDENSPSPLNEYSQKELEIHICEALARLQPREEKILRLRFGIGGYPCQTLEAIGKHFSVSKERIRQIEKKALNKLQGPAHRERLGELWSGA